MFVADWEQMVPVLLPSSAQMIYIACRVNSVVSVSLDNPNWEWRIVGKELGSAFLKLIKMLKKHHSNVNVQKIQFSISFRFLYCEK